MLAPSTSSQQPCMRRQLRSIRRNAWRPAKLLLARGMRIVIPARLPLSPVKMCVEQAKTGDEGAHASAILGAPPAASLGMSSLGLACRGALPAGTRRKSSRAVARPGLCGLSSAAAGIASRRRRRPGDFSRGHAAMARCGARSMRGERQRAVAVSSLSGAPEEAKLGRLASSSSPHRHLLHRWRRHHRRNALPDVRRRRLAAPSSSCLHLPRSLQCALGN